MGGVRLILLHPEAASRSCSDCVQWLYHDKPGQLGDRVERHGVPVKRPKGIRPPCWICPKQPPGISDRDKTPETATELTEQNWQAYLHYLGCKAVGQFPDDPIVRRNAAIIRQAEDLAERVGRIHLAVLSRANPLGG